MSTKAILTDIEGTTSSIRFVHEVLFPYARKALAAFVREQGHDAAVAALLAEASAIAQVPESDTEATIAALLKWIDEDKKVPPLKALQGHIWKSGYESGAFHGHVYPDTAEYLARWKSNGIALYVYSSGSVQAQKLLFGHSEAGDLQPYFSGYFDTRVGHKREQDSYKAIADAISLPPQEVLFLSDIEEELDAAFAVGMRTTQLVRDQNTKAGMRHTIAANFSEVILDGPGEPKEKA